MKKFLYKAALFLILLVIMDFCYGKVMTYMITHAKGGTTKAIYDVLKKDKYDILIMGSSRAKHHYNPQVLSDSLGMSCYNLGFDGNGIILMNCFYTIITQRYYPKVIIYDITQGFDIYENSTDNYNKRYLSVIKPFFYDASIDRYFGNISCSEKIKSYCSLYRFNSKLSGVLKDFFFSAPETTNGFEGLVGNLPPETKISSNEKWLNKKTDQMKLRYFGSFARNCKKHKTKLFVIASPKYGSNNLNEFNIIRIFCNQQGIPFIDSFYYYPPISNTKDLFRDLTHLNYNGAEKFSIALVHRLKECEQ